MAGVLNSEVEKFCWASYRGQPWGSKGVGFFLMNARPAIGHSPSGRGPRCSAWWL